MGFGDWYLVIVPILIGLSMLGFWAGAIVSRSVPEINSGGIEIWYHITAEVVTGVVLLFGAIAVLVDDEAPLAVVLSSLGLGMLVYTLVASPGYYLERREVPLVSMFAGVWALAIPAVIFRFVGN